MKSLAAVLVALAAMLTACANDDAATDPVSSSSEPSEPTQEPSEPTEEPSETVSTSAPVPDSELPGDPAEGMPPFADTELAVVQVPAGDQLFVRRLPDPDSEEVSAPLDPLATGVVATGRNRYVDSGSWAEIKTPEGVGWSSLSYLAYLGAVVARTSEADSVQPAESPAKLAVKVAKALASEVREEGEPVVVSDSGAEVVVDVVGYQDDAQMGERFAIKTTEADGRFGVLEVESTVICARGVTADGLCV